MPIRCQETATLNDPISGSRRSVRCPGGPVVVAMAATAATTWAAIKKDEGPIPDLRPPKKTIPFDLPEGAIFLGTLAFAFGALVLGRVFRRNVLPPPLPPEPPAVWSRRALGQVNLDAPAADALAEISQIVRRYVRSAFHLGPDAATTAEICANFAAHPQADNESGVALREFLAASDVAQFAPAHAAPTAKETAEKALSLIEQLDARFSVVRPPPLPENLAPPAAPAGPMAT